VCSIGLTAQIAVLEVAIGTGHVVAATSFGDVDEAVGTGRSQQVFQHNRREIVCEVGERSELGGQRGQPGVEAAGTGGVGEAEGGGGPGDQVAAGTLAVGRVAQKTLYSCGLIEAEITFRKERFEERWG